MEPTELTTHRAAVLALADWIGKRVTVNVGGGADEHGHSAGHLVSADGTLSAGWDESVFRLNGVADVTMFRLVESDVMIYLTDDDTFESGQADEYGVRLRFIGNVEIGIQGAAS